MNRFIASDERVLCWGRILLMLEAYALRAGDEYFRAVDECIETRVQASATHAQLAWSTRDYSYSSVKVLLSEFHAFSSLGVV